MLGIWVMWKIYQETSSEITHDRVIEKKVEVMKETVIEATVEKTSAKQDAETSRKLFNFVLDHPDVVIFTADCMGKILNVDRDIERWGWASR